MIDLHTHSSASDGTFSPSELIKYAKKNNITTMALTDHDTVSGLMEAQEEALNQNINFIPGIEISINWPKGEFHLLGLGLKTLSPELKSLISFLEEERYNRNRKMALRLQENGVDITYQELYNHYKTHNLGRPHFADYMKLKGLINNRQVAFNKYFAKGKPCYIDKGGAEVEDAIRAIESSGGIPIQAHPMSMYISFGKIEETFKELKEKGIKGIEAWHPGVRLSEAYRLEEIAKKMDFICTGGSDFHGEKIRSDRKIGFTAGGLKIQDKFWDDELKPALKEIHEDNIFSI